MGVAITPPGTVAVGAGTAPGATKVQETPLTQTSATAAANTQVQITIPLVSFQGIRIAAISGSYSAAPTGGTLTVVVNGVTVFQADITAAGPFEFTWGQGGAVCQTSQAAVVTLTAAGVSVVGRLNTAHFYSN